jgi:hypothetical protein
VKEECVVFYLFVFWCFCLRRLVLVFGYMMPCFLWKDMILLSKFWFAISIDEYGSRVVPFIHTTLPKTLLMSSPTNLLQRKYVRSDRR